MKTKANEPKDFTKVIRPCDAPCGNQKCPVFCKITFEAGILSISGVIGPRNNGDAEGGSGQIRMNFYHKDPEENDKRYSNPLKPKDLRFAAGWNSAKWFEFLHVWRRYHLNGMRAGCEHQRALGWEYDGYDKHPAEPCPECGYEFGSSWNFEAVPQGVIEFLQNLPDTDREPNWV